MPATSPAQQRFFQAVTALKHGKLKNASKSLKDAAASISDKDAAEFAARVETPAERARRVRAAHARKKLKGGG